MANKTQALKNWLIKTLGGYTHDEYASLKQNLLYEASENEKQKLSRERVDKLLLYVVDSLHNFNFYNGDEFSSRVRIIMINLRMFTLYHLPKSQYEHTLEILDNEEFEKLIYLINVRLHEAIKNFKMTEKDFEEFNCFFSELERKYSIPFLVL